ncbi:PAS domain S-box protein [Chloroflexota bacterium]
MYKEKETKNQELMLRLQLAEEELQHNISVIDKNEQRLEGLNVITDLITQSTEISHVFALVADKIIEVMNADAIRIYLLDPETNELVLEVSKGVSEEFVTEVGIMKVGESCNGTVALKAKPIVIQDTTTKSLYSRQVLVTEGIRSQLVVPLQSKEKVVGTLCIAKRKPGDFPADEISLLCSIGNIIGSGLENTRIYREKKQTLEQLQQSEEKYHNLFDNAYDAMWIHDLKGNMLSANRACRRLTGYTSEELKNIDICHLMSDRSRSCIEEIERRLLQHKPVERFCEGELCKKGGANAVVQVMTSLMTHDGQVVGFQHAARDVTAERQMQENLNYYLQQVTRVQEEERKRIARELHDETVQDLVVISRQLDKITSSEALWEVSLENVRGLRKQIESAVQGMRRFSYDLRPSVLDDLGLLPALELLSTELGKQEIATSFNVNGKARRLSSEVETMLFRIAQEAMRNIGRHSEASEAELTIKFSNGKVRMSISDNGSGFIIPQSPGELASLGKLGLTGMHERARLLGGSLTLKSKLGTGTQIIAEADI